MRDCTYRELCRFSAPGVSIEIFAIRNNGVCPDILSYLLAGTKTKRINARGASTCVQIHSEIYNFNDGSNRCHEQMRYPSRLVQYNSPAQAASWEGLILWNIRVILGVISAL